MKEFGTTFMICYVCCCVVLFFFGQLFFDNIWLAMAIPALLLTVSISGHQENAEKIEELEKRLEAMEKQEEENEAEDIDG